MEAFANRCFLLEWSALYSTTLQSSLTPGEYGSPGSTPQSAVCLTWYLTPDMEETGPHLCPPRLPGLSFLRNVGRGLDPATDQ